MNVEGFGRFFVINTIGFALFGAALFLWLRYWRRLRRITTRVRIGFVAGIWVSVFAFLVLIL